MKLSWCTDIHLNFLDADERMSFYLKILDTRCDALLITGDIAEAPCLIEILNEMASHLKFPIYFVVGNHDYYRGQVNVLRESLRHLTHQNTNLFWLPAIGAHHLNTETILLGQDGWADGRFGDYTNSRVVLNDSLMITDLFQAKILGKYPLLDAMQKLADEDAAKLQIQLQEACHLNPKKIIVLTHVPPFKESCLHEGKISDEEWLPFFGSKVMGDVLTQAAHENPTVQFLVLCGHTHDSAEYQPLDNLTVKAGAAEYGQPAVCETFTL